MSKVISVQDLVSFGSGVSEPNIHISKQGREHAHVLCTEMTHLVMECPMCQLLRTQLFGVSSFISTYVAQYGLEETFLRLMTGEDYVIINKVGDFLVE
jgi:hypothetical protein